MADWHPTAERIPGRGGILDSTAPKRGVLHSTEGDSIDGAVNAYAAAGDAWPHFTIEPGRLAQHVPLGLAARALYHGTVPTNGITAVQIEIVGYAAQSQDWQPDYLDEIAALMRWCETAAGIPREASVAFVGAEVSPARTDAPQRLTDAAWLDYRGWCGHQHVPSGNDHWDPGRIDIAYLLGPTEPNPQPDEEDSMPIFYPPQTAAAHKISEHGGEKEFAHLWLNVSNPSASASAVVTLRTKSRDGKAELASEDLTVGPLATSGWDLASIRHDVPGLIEVTATVPVTVSLRGTA